jgi:3-deoxy-7-phosphoheptulonate synthase
VTDAPATWADRPALQQPVYPDARHLDRVLRHLRGLPPLVTSWEIRRLKGRIAEAAAGKRFLLQGGDCAESFSECTDEIITARLKVLMQMSLVLVHGLRKPVVRVGRVAGQYAKPRSSDEETQDGVTLPSYRGDIINGSAFTPADRTPDPDRLLRAYYRSGLTLNFIRALSEGGFADMHHPEYWNLRWAGESQHKEAYDAIVRSIREALEFVGTLTSANLHDLERVEFYTSHEALLLRFEEALTRTVPRRDEPYNLGTHFPWIGMRTADPDGAHVAYMTGIANPIAVKIGPAVTPDWLRDLIGRLDPEDEPGRLTLIVRMGVDGVESGLPALIETTQKMGRTPLWVSDPMHGNTRTTGNGHKTRRFDDILSEVEQSMRIHAACGSRLGGVHLELTGEDVTECTGGARGLDDADLHRAYRSHVDPRLNAEQALEMALRISRLARALGT